MVLLPFMDGPNATQNCHSCNFNSKAEDANAPTRFLGYEPGAKDETGKLELRDMTRVQHDVEAFRQLSSVAA